MNCPIRLPEQGSVNDAADELLEARPVARIRDEHTGKTIGHIYEWNTGRQVRILL